MPPCENCLTLAMCRSRVSGGDLWDLIGLTQKCQHMKYFIFPSKNPLITADQAKITNPNEHLDKRILELKENLLKGIDFNDQFTFGDTKEASV